MKSLIALAVGSSLAVMSAFSVAAGPVKISLDTPDLIEVGMDDTAQVNDMIVLTGSDAVKQTAPAANECNGKWLLVTMFEERTDGSNCPATGLEKAIGNVGKVGMLGLIVYTATGGSYPIKF